jgi:hypothetical protein
MGILFQGGTERVDLVEILSLADPAVGPPAQENLFHWGDEGFTAEGIEDDPATDCDESTAQNTGPSSVRDEYTERYAELMAEARNVVDPVEYVPLFLEMEEILSDQVVFLPLWLVTETTALRSDILGGPGYTLGSIVDVFWNVDRWYLKQPQPGA